MREVYIYVASPYGFSEAGRFFYYEKLIPMIERIGYKVLDPWKLTDEEVTLRAQSAPIGSEQVALWRNANEIIAENNVTAINMAHILLACLDGVDVDSGTASEASQASIQNKPVIGYRSDFRLAGDNPGSIVNLQVEYYIHRSAHGQGIIVTTLTSLEETLREWYKKLLIST